MVTARKMHELGVTEAPLPEIGPVETAPRPLSATELIDVLSSDVESSDLLDSPMARPEPDLGLGLVRELGPLRDGGARPRSA